MHKRIFLGKLCILLVVVVSSIGLSGCGGGGNRNSAEAEAIKPELESALIAYLKQNSMGMAPTEFTSINLNEDSAEAIVKLKDAEGLYAMGVTWKIWYDKKNGKWVVNRYSDKF